jgi:hypothetical protein
MKKIIITIALTALISFVVTENYMLSHMEISGTTGNYTITVFGADFEYK